MINVNTTEVEIDGKRQVIIPSPLALHLKIPTNLKSGKIEKLFFYRDLRNEEYLTHLKEENLLPDFKTENYIINYGQNFEDYYLGSMHVDFETKKYWQWEDSPNGKLSDLDIEALAESVFNPPKELPTVTIFTPTRPSDINLSMIKTRK